MFGMHPSEKFSCDSEALSEESERRSVQLAERYLLSTAERYSGVITLQSVESSALQVGFFNIGSGRVGYWTKYRVAGRVRVG